MEIMGRRLTALVSVLMRYVSLYAHYYRAGLYVIWYDHQPRPGNRTRQASKADQYRYMEQVVGVSNWRPYPSELVWVHTCVLRTSQAKQNGKITNIYKGSRLFVQDTTIVET